MTTFGKLGSKVVLESDRPVYLHAPVEANLQWSFAELLDRDE